MRIALGLEYDGSRFCGWQSQPSGCGVQDTLEKALSVIAGESIRVVTAGRTDTGVHALHQMVHFDTASVRPGSAWVRGTNAFLPESVAILWAHPVGDEFHARFSAVSRRYLYVLMNHPVRPALLSGKAGWFHAPLDVEAMRQGAQHLVGEHDFSAFRAAECQAKSPVKHLRQIQIMRSGDLVLFDFIANAFLHHMVRNLVGSLVYVGKGKHPPAWIGKLLEGRDRTCAAPTFSPDGLYLAGIGYDPKWGLPIIGRKLNFGLNLATESVFIRG
ncbi:MAG: tRNA pseudouridine(38-40) synthase TruA [Gammaproteobacteria bacterium]|nr:tRNA pseudouridine(38-40) synthase TruA [Gammaproteobacteria bacterium]